MSERSYLASHRVLAVSARTASHEGGSGGGGLDQGALQETVDCPMVDILGRRLPTTLRIHATADYRETLEVWERRSRRDLRPRIDRSARLLRFAMASTWKINRVLRLLRDQPRHR